MVLSVCESYRSFHREAAPHAHWMPASTRVCRCSPRCTSSSSEGNSHVIFIRVSSPGRRRRRRPVRRSRCSRRLGQCGGARSELRGSPIYRTHNVGHGPQDGTSSTPGRAPSGGVERSWSECAGPRQRTMASRPGRAVPGDPSIAIRLCRSPTPNADRRQRGKPSSTRPTARPWRLPRSTRLVRARHERDRGVSRGGRRRWNATMSTRSWSRWRS